MSDEETKPQGDETTETGNDETPRKVDTHGLYRNPVSVVGALIAAIAALNVAVLVIAEMTEGAGGNPYLGIMAYIVAPAVMILGLVVLFGGMFLERRRRRLSSGGAIGYPVIDFNNGRHVRNFMMTILGAVLFFGISILGSYKAPTTTPRRTPSAARCATTSCTRSTSRRTRASPHSPVGCLHLVPRGARGPTGTSSRSSRAPTRSTRRSFKKYPTPIPTPVENLRPAQETCEQCHWPEKFWGAQLKTPVFNHFMYDEQNTPRETQMLIKVGGG
jgi:hypothetical protein